MTTITLCTGCSNRSANDGDYVMYWMQQSQREPMNAALEHAATKANELNLPLITAFALDPTYPDANERHFSFMLQGLADTTQRLARRGIKMVARMGSPPQVASADAADAALIVCDLGYFRHQRQWRRQLASTATVRVVQVEADVVVPVETASNKREWAARTLRKKNRSSRQHTNTAGQTNYARQRVAASQNQGRH